MCVAGPVCPELSDVTSGKLQLVRFDPAQQKYVDIKNPYTEHVNGTYRVTCLAGERLPSGQEYAMTVCTKEDVWNPSKMDCGMWAQLEVPKRNHAISSLKNVVW